MSMSTELMIGVATAAAGAIALYYSRVQSNTQRDTAVHEAFLAISEAMLAYPELRPVFYEDEPHTGPDAEPSGATLLRMNTLAELTLDTFELALRTRRSRKDYEEYIDASFARSTFLRMWAIDHWKFYDDALIERARRAGGGA